MSKRQFAQELVEYLAISVAISSIMTLANNKIVSRKKNFKQVVAEMYKLNDKIEYFDGMFSLTSDQKSQKASAQRQLEECTMKLGKSQMYTRFAFFGISFLINKLMNAKFNYKLTMKLPFKLPFPLNKFLQRGQKDDLDVLQMPGIAFLVNQGIRKVVTAALAIKMPRQKMPVTRMLRRLGGENADQVEKMMKNFGM